MPEHALQCMFVPDVTNAYVALLKPVFINACKNMCALGKVCSPARLDLLSIGSPSPRFWKRSVCTKTVLAGHNVSPAENWKIPRDVETLDLLCFASLLEEQLLVLICLRL